MKLAFIVLVLLIYITQINSLLCYTCKEAKSEYECQLKGKLIKCMRPTDVCMMEKRIGSYRGRIQITKTCKQNAACLAESQKNPWLGSLQTLNSVAYFCCSENKCNRKKFAQAVHKQNQTEYVSSSFVRHKSIRQDFQALYSCEPIEKISNGRVVCSSFQVGSSCQFKCEKNFILQGAKLIYCKKEGKWNDNPPVCTPIQCRPRPDSIKNGYSFCKQEGSTKVICRFGCRWSFKIKGSPMSSCSINNKESSWSRPLPVCINNSPTCKLLAVKEGMLRKCTQNSMIGSHCIFICSPQYFRVGPRRLTCKDNKDGTANWNNQEPVCKEKPKCKISWSFSITYNCTNGFYLGSRCKLKCNTTNFSTEVTCSNNTHGVVTWGGEHPNCERVCKPLLSISNGKLTCSKNNSISSVCVFSCDENYFLIGSSYRTCIQRNQNTFLWSGTKPKCLVRPKCKQHLLTEALSVNCTNSQLISGTKCIFSCSSGFDLIGQRITFCNEKRIKYAMWDRIQPICRGKCEDLGELKNGRIICDQKSFIASRCQFTCNLHYKLIGSNILECIQVENAKNRWNESKPFCKIVPRCSTPKQNDSTIKSDCTNESYINSTCKFSCPSNYKIIGSEVRTCAPNNKGGVSWSSTIPSCRGKCPDLPKLLHGATICSDKAMNNSICKFTCNEVFSLIGSSSTTCLQTSDKKTFMWSGHFPECKETPRCLSIKKTEGLIIKCSSETSRVGTICQFECEKGYELIGKNKLTCITTLLSSTKWNMKQPHCKGICNKLPIIENGAITCNDSSYFQSTCQASCDKHYKLIGFETIKCIKYSANLYRWSRKSPSCKSRPQCKNLVKSDSLLMKCSDEFYINSFCRFACPSEFTFVGNEVLRCTTDILGGVSWNGTIPECKIKCLDISDFDNGIMTCTDRFWEKTVCRFKCEPNYDLVGSNTTSCSQVNEKNYKWTQSVPFCREKPKCTPVKQTEGLIIECDNEVLYSGTKCSLHCKLGYERVGAETVACNNLDDVKAIWNTSSTFCKGKCKEISNLNNGSFNCSHGLFHKSNCTFNCNKNFEVIGPQSIVCSKSRNDLYKWNERVPECKMKPRCIGLLGKEDSLLMSCSNEFYLGSNCSFSCLAGYKLIGENVLSCIGKNKANWNNILPYCRETCRNIPTILDGHMNCSDSFYTNSTCSFKCKSDRFQLIGDLQITCLLQQNGTADWNNNSPICKVRKTCVDRTTTNATSICTDSNYINSTCEFSCDEKHLLVGNKYVSCLQNMSSESYWNSSMPICKAACDSLHKVINGDIQCSNSFFIGSKCEFSCNENFEMYGEPKTTCQLQEDAKHIWSNPQPTCKKIPQCRSLNVKKAEISCTSKYLSNSTCYISCPKKFHLIGADEITCERKKDFAEWSQDPPVCQEKCRKMRSISNGQVECSEKNFQGSTCTFSCDEKYDLIGKNTSTCTQFDDESVNWDNKKPRCQKYFECQSLTRSLGLNFSCNNGFRVGSSCQFSCQTDFQLKGPQQSSCYSTIEGNFKWDNKKPKCIPMCKNLNAFEDGSVHCTKARLRGSVCSFSCNKGFKLEGSKTISCGQVKSKKQANWNSTIPACVQICDVAKIIENGQTICSNENKINSFCQFICNSGFKLVGSTFIYCQNTAFGNMWTPAFPQCLPTCKLIKEIDDRNVFCSNDNFIGSTCSFSCSGNHELIGSTSVQCLSGTSHVPQWLPQLPTCMKRCPLVLNMKHQLCTESYFLGSICVFTCNDGDTPVVSKCQTDKHGSLSWSVSPPKCKAKCQQIPKIINAEMECNNGEEIGSTCTFKCNDDYTLQGIGVVMCIQSLSGASAWSSPPPLCLPLCAPFEKLEGQKVSCTRDRMVNSFCQITCEEGYEIEDIKKSISICKFDKLSQTADWTSHSRCI